jgi:transposase
MPVKKIKRKVVRKRAEIIKDLGEDGITSAAQIITEERRNGLSAEECVKLLALSKHSEKEIEKIMDESDKLM